MNGIYIFIFSFTLVGLCGIWLWKRSYRPELENLIIGAWSASAGTLFGFLVALSVYYIQEQQNSAEESRAAATRARLITLLKSELSYDLQAIKIRIEAKTLPAVVNEIKSPLKF